MTKQLSTISIIGTIIVGALIVPMFALACTRSGATSPSSFNDLNTTFSRFNR